MSDYGHKIWMGKKGYYIVGYGKSPMMTIKTKSDVDHVLKTLGGPHHLSPQDKELLRELRKVL